MLVYAVVDDALAPDFPLGVELEVFVRREHAERFIDEVRGDDPEVAANLRVEERESRTRTRATVDALQTYRENQAFRRAMKLLQSSTFKAPSGLEPLYEALQASA